MARTPVFKLSYLGKDITQDIKPFTTSIALSDKLEGESDEVEISIDNADLRWMDSWLPKEGDTITLQLGYEGEALTPETTFEVDEPEFSGAPDVLRLQGQATPITASLRQKRTQAYENVTLRAIAQQIARRHNLELVGNVPDLKLERVTQRNQSDLEFLRDTAIEYGIIFKVEGCKRLVFYRESELEAAEPVLTITRTQVSRYRISRGAVGTYAGVKFSYYDPKTGKHTEVKFDAAGKELTTQSDGKSEPATGDLLNIRERFENLEQGKIKAQEALRRANRGAVTGDLELEGDVRLSAGINITLEGFRKLSGKYQIKAVRHRLTKRSGYTTSIELTGLELRSGE